jgi:hypothetical protein
MSGSFVPDSRDQKILEIIGELRAQLKVPNCPRNLLWAERIKTGDSDRSGSKPIGSDECYLGKNAIVLPMHMRDKLEPEEWRPIIASGIILNMRLRPGVVKKIKTRLWFPPLTMLILAVFFFAQGPFDSTGNFHGPTWVLPLLSFSLVAVLVVPWTLYGRYYRQAKLIADRDSAEIVGKQAFLDVMMKLDQMGLQDLEKAKRNHFTSPRLGINIRINNIRQAFSISG